ncbi:MAG: helix-turn-helix domain-containing protein [Planctomycetota bacterium]
MTKRPKFINLSPSEVETLKRFMKDIAIQNKSRPRLRGNALWYSSQKHWTVKHIAESLGCSEETIYHCFKRYKENGIEGLYDSDRPLKLTLEQIKQVIQVSGLDKVYRDKKERRQFRWSYRKIAKWVKDNLGIAISHESIRQIIQKKYLVTEKANLKNNNFSLTS